ncbi:hypothetical protein ACQKM9_04730 [Viridibacillus sp. NPDC093762]|uniref:hypothetical protein n=1 Tax=Viridibacillus sp. NPDC093762 TaxID=3390720 RepID=UPI003CFC1FE7
MSKFLLLFLTPFILMGCSQLAENTVSSMYLDGKINVDNEEYNLIQGFYTYKDEEVESKKLDPFSPIEAADQFDTLTVEKNSEIEIELENKTTYITVYQWNEDGLVKEVQLVGNVLTVPSEEGYYVYEVVGKWKNGETTLVFDIDVT